VVGWKINFFAKKNGTLKIYKNLII